MISVNYGTILTNGWHYEWQIVNGDPDNPIGVANLISGTIQSACMEQLSIGNTIASQLTLNLHGVTVDTSSPLIVKFRATDGTNNSNWYTKGKYYIDTVDKSPYSEETTVKAFDAMLKGEVEYQVSGGWLQPTDLVVLVGSDGTGGIAADMGVSIESATLTAISASPIQLNDAPPVGPNGVTDRQMLSYIAALRGGNWVITADEKLKLIYPYATPTSSATVGDEVSDFKAVPAETVKRIKVIKDSSTYFYAPNTSGGNPISEADWLALGGRCIEVTMPFASQTVADSLYTLYSNKTFYPYTAPTAYVGPEYEVGDGISFLSSNSVTSVIASQSLSLDALSASSLTFKGEEAIQSYYPYVDPAERDLLYQVSTAQETADAAGSAAEAAQSALEDANAMEQLIYISKPTGTTSVSANTTWVTNTTGAQNTWTTKRPVYDRSYPVLFVATQRQSVSGDVVCTTPLIDETTTTIDGGHIITGTITANKIATGSLTVGCFDSSVQTSLQNGNDALSTANANATEINNLKGYVSIDNGVLTLGKRDNEFTAVLDNTELAFNQGSDKVAYISNSKLFITEAEILSCMQLGHYQWVIDPDSGRMSLKWVN